MKAEPKKHRRGKAVSRFRYSEVFVSVLTVVCILAAWKIGALLIDAEIILPPPEDAARSLIRILSGSQVWGMVGATLLRVFWSFLLAFVCGTAVGIAAGYSSLFRAAVQPVLTVLRTTPVMAVILLALIWFRTSMVPVFVSLLMTFPVVCGTVMEGVKEIDPRLLEMGKVFRVSKPNLFIHISLPSMVPYLMAAVHSTFGLAWKVVIAAEVLSLPDLGIGSGMQEAQLTLETADVMAWTVVAVLLSGISDWLIRRGVTLIPWRRG